MNFRPVGAESFHEDERTDRRTDMTKPIVAFGNFANAPIKRNREAGVIAGRIKQNQIRKVWE
jgi:hypothetical protein